jgi:phage shock protein A
MEGVDFKLLINIGSVLLAVGASMAIVRTQLKQLIQDHEALEKRVGQVANALDRVAVQSSAEEARTETKLSVISTILSVENLERHNREIATMEANIKGLRRDVDEHRKEYLSAHNGAHKYVPPPYSAVTVGD